MRNVVHSRLLSITSIGSLALAGVISACSSSSGAKTPGDAGADGGCTGNRDVITLHNFDDRCTVSLDGAATSVSSSYEACVQSGNSLSIVVAPASTQFELGPTPFVSISGLEVPDGSTTTMGDGGFGSTSTVQVGASFAGAGCVLVCCPLADGTGCDSSSSGYTTFLSDCAP